MSVDDKPWEGSCARKPWHYKVTAAIPCLDCIETLGPCVELLRLQTVRPYIMLIDTGSMPYNYLGMKQYQAEDCEVHFLRLNGTLHPSDFPAMAMDVAFALCRTEYLFATHADCYLRKRTFLEETLDLMTTEGTPVAGYEITPREHEDWPGMVSHTATMYHMPVMDQIGFGWSLRRLAHLYGITDYRPNPERPTWPDTEILGNYLLRQHNIRPRLLGSEENFSRHVDDNIDHPRSYVSSKLYNAAYYAQAAAWLEQARDEAMARVAEWKKNASGAQEK